MQLPTFNSKRRKECPVVALWYLIAVLVSVVVIYEALTWGQTSPAAVPDPKQPTPIAQSAIIGSADYVTAPVLISYSYFEKDDVQKSNFEYFLAAGTIYPKLHQNMHWVFVVSGKMCSPCGSLYSFMKVDNTDYSGAGVKEVFSNEKFTLITRTENVGMDIAGHNITIEYLRAKKQLTQYKYFIFLNSSVKGPFFPAYLPKEWHWTYAFLSRIENDIHAVSSSLVCLPKVDAGGKGPRLESWAYAVDLEGLRVLLEAGVMNIRECKLCGDKQGIVVGGEYGITLSMFAKNYNIATLMSRYARGTDWRNPQHWDCNNGVHPSRHGTYDGIAFHPYETIFVKSSWHVADPYTRRYAAWSLSHLAGDAGTQGQFDEKMYRYAISLEAQAPNHLEDGYKVQAAAA